MIHVEVQTTVPPAYEPRTLHIHLPEKGDYEIMKAFVKRIRKDVIISPGGQYDDLVRKLEIVLDLYPQKEER